MVDIDTLSIVLTGIGIIVAITYYALTLRNATKTRELQIFMNIVQSLNSEDSMRTWAELINAEFTDYDDFMTKYDSSVSPEHFGKRGSLWYNYNTIGYLLMDGNISITLVYQLVGNLAVLQWNRWKDIIFELREKQDIPTYFRGFEYLVTELAKYDQEHPELKG